MPHGTRWRLSVRQSDGFGPIVAGAHGPQLVVRQWLVGAKTRQQVVVSVVLIVAGAVLVVLGTWSGIVSILVGLLIDHAQATGSASNRPLAKPTACVLLVQLR